MPARPYLISSRKLSCFRIKATCCHWTFHILFTRLFSIIGIIPINTCANTHAYTYIRMYRVCIIHAEYNCLLSCYENSTKLSKKCLSEESVFEGISRSKGASNYAVCPATTGGLAL